MGTDSEGVLGGEGMDEGTLATIEVGAEEEGGEEDGGEVDGEVDRGKEGQQEVGCQLVPGIPK